ncbi:MAG: molybdopterin cofactor-binding domain-containing protein [Chloroflexota bacterium]
MSDAGLSIIGSVEPGFPRREGYGTRAYGNTAPSGPTARWLLVKPDGRVTVFSGKVEYGQNIRTGLAVEVADELRVPLATVDVVLGDTNLTPWDMGTFGSQSTARVGVQLRMAAATAREVLLELASQRLDLPREDLVLRDGSIASKSDPGRAFTYADLVGNEAIERYLDDAAPLNEPGEMTVMRSDVRRIDAISRVTGAAQYAQDVLRPGMLYARILRAPSFGSRAGEVDTTAAEHMPGVVQVVREGDMIAVLAEDDESAERALHVVQAKWEGGFEGSSVDLPRILLETKRDPVSVQQVGDVEEAFTHADNILEETYYAPHITPLPLEPRAAVAEWDGDKLTVWAGTQRPFGLRSELSGMLRVPEANVHVISMEIGGGFGTKSWYPTGVEAAKLARIAGRPVRVAYTRAEDLIEGTCRPAALIQVKSAFRSDGTITAWQFEAIHAGPTGFIAHREANTPYAIENAIATVYCSATLVRVGSYRSLGAALNNFARESHMDEIAAQLKIDPFEFRMRNMSEPRYRHVLEEAANAFGWSPGAAPTNRGFGISLGEDVGSYVATCVEVGIEAKDIRVRRVVTALDCGLVVNPEGVRNQVEGSTVMGIGGALYEAIEIGDGVILNTGLSRYQVPRITDTPDIQVVLAGDPNEPSTGAGEPGIVTIAPAIANAVFDATGQRIRELPLKRQLR